MTAACFVYCSFDTCLPRKNLWSACSALDYIIGSGGGSRALWLQGHCCSSPPQAPPQSSLRLMKDMSLRTSTHLRASPPVEVPRWVCSVLWSASPPPCACLHELPTNQTADSKASAHLNQHESCALIGPMRESRCWPISQMGKLLRCDLHRMGGTSGGTEWNSRLPPPSSGCPLGDSAPTPCQTPGWGSALLGKG